MPNIKSMVKDVRKSRERHVRNVAAKSKIKTHVKKARTAIEAGDAEAAQKAISEAVSVIDKAAGKGIIHKKAAARRKSRLMRTPQKAGS